jgi:serine/threonine-protein kinase
VTRAGTLVGGRYLLEHQIGEGAMGSVWKAVHHTLGRGFAVKFLKCAGHSAERLEERFLREARLAAAVSHRYVVSIVDFGTTDEGTPYIVMEYLQGESLAQRLRRTPSLGARELVRIVAESLRGLDAVHEAGVVHRDVKPENIMLVREAGSVVPKLVDFGISRAERANGPHGGAPPNLTWPGTVCGTPSYMSPEQVAGGSIDRRSDIYSTGVILYEALVGIAPFSCPDLTTRLRSIADGGAPPVVALRPELGEAVSRVVETAMMTSPAARFATAGDMAAALLTVVDHLPEGLACPDPDAVAAVPGRSVVPAQSCPTRGQLPGLVARSTSALLVVALLAGFAILAAWNLGGGAEAAAVNIPLAADAARTRPAATTIKPLPPKTTPEEAPPDETPIVIPASLPTTSAAIVRPARRDPAEPRSDRLAPGSREPVGGQAASPVPPEIFRHPGF